MAIIGHVTVTVTWMDGTQGTYEGYQALVTDRDNLVITQREHSEKPKMVIPLCNVRHYTVDEQ